MSLATTVESAVGAFDLQNERLQVLEHEHVDSGVRPMAETDVVANDRFLLADQPIDVARPVRHDLQNGVFHAMAGKMLDRIRHGSRLLQSQLQAGRF